jgi:RNA polymerase sigma-70 factor (ECF subfamily)
LVEAERDTVVEPPVTSLERAQEAALARRAVESLVERDRLALLMREEGLDYHEIAEALGMSVGSMGTTLARARKRLAETFESMQRAADERQQRRGGHAGA